MGYFDKVFMSPVLDQEDAPVDGVSWPKVLEFNVRIGPRIPPFSGVSKSSLQGKINPGKRDQNFC